MSLEAVMEKDIQQIVDSLVKLWNTGNADVAGQLYRDDAKRYDPNQPARSSQEIARYVAAVRTGYPDFKLEIKETIAEGNRLIIHWTCTGTHQGDFLGIPATGKRITISGLTLEQIENGKIVEEYVYFDRLTMLEQLGVSPQVVQSQVKRTAS
jgi:steroid delta-isomerase-like uncharacterized protein